MVLRTARTVAILSLTAALCACGGSGGGGGAPVVVVLGDGTFNGTYFAVLKTGGLTGGPDGRGTTGTLTADGAGNASHTQMINDSGSVSGPTTTPYDFNVAADGTLELGFGSTVFARGGITADGRVALLGSVMPGAFPGIFVLLRREGLYDLTSLSSGYHLAEFVFSFLSTSIAFTGNGAFDGTGGATFAFTGNSMGAIGPLSGAISYTVIGDGTSTATIAAAVPPVLEGGVGLGGDVALWAGSTTPGQSPNLLVAVKEPASATVATLQGAYWIVLLERDPATGEFRSLNGTATANGAGGLTLLATSNTEGVLAAEPLQTTTYSVTASGKLTVDAGGSVLVGGITQDGRFAAVAGGTVAGSSPTIAILSKK